MQTRFVTVAFARRDPSPSTPFRAERGAAESDQPLIGDSSPLPARRFD
jgi:hypothetical protein